MELLTKEQIHAHLRAYYLEHFGERSTDEWWGPPATNVWMFRRDGRYYALTCHILSGEVTVKEEG